MNTLRELRCHWELYVRVGQLPSARKKRMKEVVLSRIRITKAIQRRDPTCIHVAPLGHISSNPRNLPAGSSSTSGRRTTSLIALIPRDISAATLVNPTFVYSLAGEGFALHYGTAPILPSHLAPMFLDSKRDAPTIPELVDCAKSQPSGWVKHSRAFVQDRPGGLLTIRLFASDTFFVCPGASSTRTNPFSSRTGLSIFGLGSWI